VFEINAPRVCASPRDFTAASQSFSLADLSAPATLTAWNRHVCDKPQLICSTLACDIPFTLYVATRIFPDGVLKLAVFLIDDRQSNAGSMEHLVRFQFQEADLGSASIEDTHTRHALAARLIRNTAALYERWNIGKVHVVAARTVGGYAWARMGWHPTPESWAHLKTDVRNRYATHITQFRPDERTLILAILQSDDPRQIWRLADLPRVIIQDGHTGMPIGKVLLLGTAWVGYLDLGNDRAYGRLQSYLTSKGLL
jgi:hypothetical protein